MTKKNFLSKFLLFAVLVLAIATCSIMAQAQTEIASPIAQAEGETGATLTGKEKLAHVKLSDLFPTGYTAGAKIEIMDGDNEIGTLTVDKDATSGLNGYVFKLSGLYTFKPNNDYNVKKFIYVAPTGGMVTFSLDGDQPSSTYMSIEKPTTAEKELINASFPDVKWDAYNASGVVIDSSYYNDTQNPYVFKHAATLKFGDIFLIYEENKEYTITYDCTNDNKYSPTTVKVGDATFLIRYEGWFNNGYPAYGDGSFNITIYPVPGYVINYVIFTSSIDNPFDASELKFPGLEATYENGNLKVTGMQPGQTYELYSGGSAKGLLTSITVNYIEHEHTGVYEPGSDETHHFDQCVCLWRVNEEEHTFGEGTITKEPTHQALGKAKYTCTECGYEKEEQVAPNFADTEVSLDKELRYNGSIQFAVYTVKYKGSVVGMSNYKVVSGVARGKEPGDYTFTIGPKDGSIFEGTKEFSFTIEKGNYDMSAVVFEDMTVDYNGTAQSILATNLPAGVTATYEGNAQTDVGEYTITAKFTSNADDAQYYNPIADMTATLTINKATYDMSAISMANKTVTYNGEVHSLAIEGALPDGVTVSYENNDKINAGEYNVIANFTGSTNYNDIAPLTAILTINKATYDMSGISMAGKTVTYNGTAHSLAIEGTLPTGVTVSYENNDKINAGEYNVIANFTGSTNYNDIAAISATLTIEKATYDMSGISMANKTVTYDGNTYSLAIEGTLPTGVTLVSYENNDKTNAGVYTVTANFAGDANNYNAIAPISATLTIEKATYDMSAVVFENSTVIYNGSAYSIEATNLPTGVTVSYENNGKIVVGTYEITAIFTGDADNYNAIDNMTAILTINKATYDMSEVVFEDSTVIYNGSAYSIEATNLPTGVTVSYENNGKIVVGTYEITATFTGDEDNYNAIENMTAILTINKATYDMSEVVFEDSTVIYNGSAYSIEATNLPTGVTVSYENNGKTVVGTYEITATFTGDADNYNAIDNMTATLTINKATYDMSGISMADKTVTYDGNTYSLAIEGTLPTGVTVVSYENNDKTYAGVYTVTANFTGDANNYNAIAPISATLTIEKANYDMSEVVFEDSTVIYNGSAYYIEATNLPDGVTVSYENNGKTVVGTYEITATFTGDADNYNAIADMTATLTIKKATYDMSGISIADKTVVYNGETQFIVIEGTLPTGVTVSYENNGKTVVGTYEITATFTGDADNYNAIADMTATLTINKATYDMSGISIADKIVAYNGEVQSIVIEGTLPTGVTVSYTNNDKTDVGVYTITAVFTGDANYNAIGDMTATLTINAVVVENDVKDEGTGRPIAKVEKEDGFAPDTQLEVSPFEEGNVNDVVEISKKEEVIGSYELDLQKDGSSVQPDGEMVVKMLIPTELEGRNFRITHVKDGSALGNIAYEIEDGYAVIQTAQLGEFVFVAEKEGLSTGAIIGVVLGSIFFLLIVIFIVLFILWKKRDLKPLSFLVPAYRGINNVLFKTKFNDVEQEMSQKRENSAK